MKRWNDNEINEAIQLHNNGFRFDYIAIELNRTTKSVKEKLNEFNINNNKSIISNKKNCLNCDNEFISLIKENRKFCSQSCAAQYNNKKRPKQKKYKIKTIKTCLNCGNAIKGRGKKFCSIKCQHIYERNEIFQKIENGDNTLSHKLYKSYLIEKHGEMCMKCGWNEINPITKKVPIELEHKDGNSENNNLSNLELLCPNCHSLTSTYKALNIGNGRHKRKERYKNGKSY
jgi:predicted nucleic acid-binding Zn ribbon protein